MAMNRDGDGLIPLNEDMAKLFDELQTKVDNTDPEDLYGKLCQAQRVGQPHIIFKVGEKVILKDHEWEVKEITPKSITLQPIRRTT